MRTGSSWCPHDIAAGEDTEPGDKSPFVVDGGGAPCGLSKTEHFQWALTKEHPFIEKGPYKVNPYIHFWRAIDFANKSTAEQIDEFRSEVINKLHGRGGGA